MALKLRLAVAPQHERETMHNTRPVYKRLLGGNHIFTLDEAAGVLPRPDVAEDDVVR